MIGVTEAVDGVELIRARAEAATPGPWRWQGNIDTGEPYLASRAPGMGASVLVIGTEDRSTTGRAADEVRSYARESGIDPEEAVEDWATDRYGEPIKEPRLWFYTDHLAVYARKHVTFEVAPGATSRADRRVYRADITGIRHPDAEFIAHARADVDLLLTVLDQVTTQRDEIQENRNDLARKVAEQRAAIAELQARLADRERQHADRLAEQATLGDTGICRTCTLPITFATVEEPGFLPRTGWSDGARRDALVCFGAISYRHVPLVGRERGIWDAATKAATPAARGRRGGEVHGA